jgi:putative nucleotidyltransferase with HDIG domain
MKRLALCLLKDRQALLDLDVPRIDWEFRFAKDRQSAFEALPLAPYEAVVTDDPWREGTQNDVFAELAVRCPGVLRVRLFTPSSKSTGTVSECYADQCVPKPCAVEALVSSIERGNLLRTWLSEPAMSSLLPRIRKVPSVPSLYFRLVHILETGSADLEDVAKIMGEDFAMTAKLLQMVNSPFFGLGRTITNPAEAVAHLGLAQTKALVLFAQVFSSYSEEKTSKFSLDQLWKHSLATANLARAITESETNNPPQADLAFTAGLLHDVGKLFHAVNCPEEYETLLTQTECNQMAYADVERCLIGTTHAELGACVLGTWGLPTEILEVIAFHHAPARHFRNCFSALTAVHVANAFDHELNPAAAQSAAVIDYAYLGRIAWLDRFALWRERRVAAVLPLAA